MVSGLLWELTKGEEDRYFDGWPNCQFLGLAWRMGYPMADDGP